MSFPGPLASGATDTDVEATVAVDTELTVREVILGREGIAILPFDGPAPARLDEAPPLEPEPEDREVIFGFIEVLTFSGLGTATDMIVYQIRSRLVSYLGTEIIG